MNDEFDPDEPLLTATQVRLMYKFPDKMMAMLKPAVTYKKIGMKYPVKLYYKKDVEALANSEIGQQLMAEAEQRRKAFWESMQRRVDMIRELQQKQEGDDNVDLQ